MKIDDSEIIDLYKEWIKSMKIECMFIPFCKNDEWSGDLVLNFVKFVIRYYLNEKKGKGIGRVSK